MPRSAKRLPLSPAQITRHEPGSLPAYLSNGLIGLRPGWTPPVSGVAIVNGFVGLDPTTQVEGFARAPYPLGLDLAVGGVRMSDLGERSTLREQRYDFAAGELTTELTFRAGERTAEVRIVQFCSRTFPTVCAQQVDVHVDGPCSVELSVGVDPAGIPGSWSKRVVRPGGSADGLLL